jgi:molybdopterin converting factor small subunit
MFRLTTCVLAAALASPFAMAVEPDVLKVGDEIAAFHVKKVSAMPDDSVAEGDELCYRCKYGKRPMVMVFTRASDENLNKLFTEINEEVGEHAEQELKGLVVMIGSDADGLEKQGATIAKELKLENIPITVAEDTEHGPADYKLQDADEVTVIIAKEGAVAARFAGTAAELDIEGVMNAVHEVVE